MTDKNKIPRQALPIYDPAFKLLASKPRPDFMLIGAAKSGTTSFSSYLPQHPQVKGCVPKEPNFWSWRSCSREQYQELFATSGQSSATDGGQHIGGEYSTSYLLHPLAPRRVAARLPGVKIIVLLRNPVDRAYSHYIMAQRNGAEPHCSFEEIVEREMAESAQLLAAHRRGYLDSNFRTAAHRNLADGRPLSVAAHTADPEYYPLSTESDLLRFYVTSYVFRSIYCDQLWRWLQLFPSEQIKIIESRKLLHQRAEVMRDVAGFLELDPDKFSDTEMGHTWGGGANTHNTPGDYQPMNAATRARLTEFFKPYNNELFNLIGEEYDWS
jgi:hypothetical protein